MHSQQNTNSSNRAVTKPARRLLTVAQFAEIHTAFSQAALRNLVFKADKRDGANGEIPGNGLIEAGALIRIGRKVLIDEDRFFGWVDEQNDRGSS